MVNDNMKTKTEREELIESAIQGLFFLSATIDAELRDDKGKGLPQSYIDARQLQADKQRQLAKDFLHFAATL